MIRLPSDQSAAIDAAISGALDRLQARGRAHGDAVSALTASAARAAGGGKRLRPALVVAAFNAFGGDAVASPALWDVAAAFELLHTAFVVHDDLIDRDTERRGMPNVAGEFRLRGRARGAGPEGAALAGDAAAVLAGDLLLFEASRIVAWADVPRAQRATLFSLLEDAVLVSSAGELADVEHATAPDCPDTPELLSTAHDKTAVYSFRAPLTAGAVLAGADEHQLSALGAAAGRLGLAFQLVDDLIGTFGTHEQAGREPGADLREAKRTPLISLARRSSSWTSVSSALALAHTGPIAVRAAQRELDASGARRHLVHLVRSTLRDARQQHAPAALPDRAAELLDALATAIEERIP